MRRSLIFSLLLLCAAAQSYASEPIRVAVLPLVNDAPCRFAGKDIGQTTGIMSEALMEFLGKAFDASDIVAIPPTYVSAALEDLKLDFQKSGQRKAEKLEDVGKKLGATFVLLVAVDWTDQKNPEPGALAGNPNVVKSSSKVRIRVWLQNVAENRLALDGSKKTFEAEAKGPYFGTVDPREMSADPTTKGIVIQQEYKKRARYLGRALVTAAKGALKGPLDLKDPPPTQLRNRISDISTSLLCLL